MPDPIRDLENLRLDGADVLPVPPSEIRRRGERLRRRRRATTVAGAAAAVAVIAVTGALASGSLGGDRGAPPVTTPTPTETATPDPTPSEPEDPVPSIPETFPLDAGLSGAKVSAVAGMASLDYCGTTPLARLDPLDVRTAAVHGGETAITRTLYLFPSPAAASAAHDDVMEAAWACSFADRSGGATGDVTIRKTVASWPGNTVTEDFAWGERTTEPAVEIVHVVSRGTALLVTSAFGSWSSDLTAGVESTRAQLRPVVEAMDVFDR